MNKVLKWSIVSIAVLALLLFGFFKYAQSNTKKHSPEDIVTYVQGDLELEVFYNRPYKKEREIFGGLVPYGEVWRTGANEATTFSSNKNLVIDNKELQAGKYTLWTIPGAKEWTIIFNSKMYRWGVNFDQMASREAEFDVLKVNVPVSKMSNAVEQFTISFNNSGSELAMLLEWDRTKLAVPISSL